MAYPIPRHIHRAEEIIKRSRFIATVAHTPSDDDAKAFVAQIREEFPDATHNCWAYVAGPPGSTARVGMSDDGEPHGTAGRPMLSTLLHSGVGEITAVVTRYFGGTKLGTGGLVRAYSGAVQAALADLSVKKKIIPARVSVIVDYANLSGVTHLAESFEAEIVGEEYTADVSLLFELAIENAERFEASLVDVTNGEILVERVGK